MSNTTPIVLKLQADALNLDVPVAAQEKKDANPITQQFFAQNISVVGNVTEAQVTVEQSATANLGLDADIVRDVATQIREALDLLPTEEKNKVRVALTDLESDLAAKAPNQSKLRSVLGTIRRICEGASGNLAAQGIVGIISNLFSGT